MMSRRALATLLLLVLGCAGSVQASSITAEAIDLYKARRYVEAREAFEKVIAADPRNASAAYYLGDLALMRNAPQEAVQWLEKATALDPKSSEYFRALGDAYGLSAQRAGLFSKLGLAQKSHRAYEQAVALAPDNIEVRYALFNFCRQAPEIAGGGMDQAQIQALEIRKRDDLRGSLALVEITVAEHKFTEAFSMLDSIRLRHPGSALASYQFGRAAAMCGQRLNDGAAALRQYLATTPDEDEPPLWTAHWRLGEILEKMRDVPGARAEYAAALKLNPTQPQLVEAARRLK